MEQFWKQRVVTFSSELGESLKRTLCLYVCVYQNQPAVAAHCFKEGMKLEAFDPAAPVSIRPATVTKVTDFPINWTSHME